jgi:hypothetical protein
MIFRCYNVYMYKILYWFWIYFLNVVHSSSKSNYIFALFFFSEHSCLGWQVLCLIYELTYDLTFSRIYPDFKFFEWNVNLILGYCGLIFKLCEFGQKVRFQNCSEYTWFLLHHSHRTIMAVPTIDSIAWDTFRYRPVYTPGSLFRGIFEWGFLYKESSVPLTELNKRQHKSEPYWWEHGSHDTNLVIKIAPSFCSLIIQFLLDYCLNRDHWQF